MTVQRAYVSGLWLLADNPKYDVCHYHRLLPRTLDLLRGSALHFHSNSDTVFQLVADLAQARGIELKMIELEVDELPCWDIAKVAVDACARMRLDQFARPDHFADEKGSIHYWRDLKGGGAQTYQAMLAIWLSKVALTAKVACNWEGNSVAWADASIARFNGRRSNWDFSRDRGDPARISHYGNYMRFFGQPLPLNASYLEGGLSAWEALERLFDATLAKAVQMPYGHDEETVLGQSVTSSPDLFRCIGHQLRERTSFRRVRSALWQRFEKIGCLRPRNINQLCTSKD